MLTHYIIVRKDLPLGVCAAMITHAAGDSAALYEDPYDGRFRGCRAVVLEATDEAALRAASDRLARHGVARVEIVESGEVYNGQLMAVGVVPVEPTKRVDWDKTVEDVMRHFHTLKELDNPVAPA